MELFVISGGLSGLGAELVRASWERGCLPVVVGRNVSRDAPAAIQHIPFGRIEQLNEGSLMRGLEHFTPPYCERITLCLNAGVIEPLGRVETLDLEKMNVAVNINYVWPMHLTHGMLNFVGKRQIPLRIILISTGAAGKAIKNWSVYCSSKAAIEHFIHCVAIDHPEVVCVSIDPGAVATTMQETIAKWESDFGDGNAGRAELKTPRLAAREVLFKSGFWGGQSEL